MLTLCVVALVELLFARVCACVSTSRSCGHDIMQPQFQSLELGYVFGWKALVSWMWFSILVVIVLAIA